MVQNWVLFSISKRAGPGSLRARIGCCFVFLGGVRPPAGLAALVQHWVLFSVSRELGRGLLGPEFGCYLAVFWSARPPSALAALVQNWVLFSVFEGAGLGLGWGAVGLCLGGVELLFGSELGAIWGVWPLLGSGQHGGVATFGPCSFGSELGAV